MQLEEKLSTGKTVLLACELGGGLGHVDPLVRLAHGLAELGCQPVLAVRNLVLAWPKVRHTPFPVIQTPVYYWQPLSEKSFNYGAGYSDTLARTGFLSEDTLLPLVRAWEKQLSLIKPALVIADYSPLLCLTVYRTLPALNVGFGFILPPTDGPNFPPLLPGRPPMVADERLLAVVQAVQRIRGQPIPETLTGAFADAEPFLTVLPELDHYHAVRQEGHLGPIVELLPSQPWPETPRFFAYLKANNPAFEVIMAALAQCDFPGQVFALGANQETRAKLSRPNLEIFDSPPPINDILPRVSVVIHHGGINLSQQALAAGRPQLVFTEHLEAVLTAVRLHELGVAHYVKDEYPLRMMIAGIRELMTAPSFRNRAQQVASQIQAHGPWNPLPKILARCRELLEK